ncbi:hypothetical protein CEP53_012820 [Fusarium sp. AF-6]|nr:hypothetical protein CEP53_012820 [Fusarium sp. AF-6]
MHDCFGLIAIVNNFTVSVNTARSQATACCLEDRRVDHKYKRPTFVAPLDREDKHQFNLFWLHPMLHTDNSRDTRSQIRQESR